MSRGGPALARQALQRHASVMRSVESRAGFAVDPKRHAVKTNPSRNLNPRFGVSLRSDQHRARSAVDGAAAATA
jgi:hypothetical protein